MTLTRKAETHNGQESPYLGIYTCFTHDLFFVEVHDLEHIPLFVNY